MHRGHPRWHSRGRYLGARIHGAELGATDLGAELGAMYSDAEHGFKACSQVSLAEAALISSSSLSVSSSP